MTIIRLLQACRFETSSLPFPRICPYFLEESAVETEVVMNSSDLDKQIVDQQFGQLVNVIRILEC